MTEKDCWKRGDKTADFYRQALAEGSVKRPRVKVLHPEDMPWEDTPHGRIKHIINERMENVETVIDLYMQELPPGGRSGKHRHMAEECLFILEGKGYDLHWDVEAELKDKYYWRVSSEPKTFEWEAGDLVIIPVNTVHQHFNADPEKPARFISAVNNLYRHLGYADVEQLEEASPGPTERS